MNRTHGAASQSHPFGGWFNTMLVLRLRCLTQHLDRETLK
jgi:hypothetical protein